MKTVAVDPDRTTGAAVLRRVDEPTEKEPSQSPQMQPSANDKAATAVSGGIEAHIPPINSQHAQPGAGTSTNPRSAKWTYHEERFFFEYLRMIKGMQIRDDCVVSIATALRTKDDKQVGAYYDNIITSMKRHLNTNIKKESSLANLHYTMVVYWERVMLPAAESKYNKAVKSKDSKGDTAKKPSQHQHQQYRSDAGNGGGGGATTNNTVGGQSTGKKTKKKHKTAGSTHAPGNGTSITPTQSICIEEEDQNQIAVVPPPPATAGAGAVASSGPLPIWLLKVRLLAASSTYLALMKKHRYSGAACMTLPAHTSLVDMLNHLETTWNRAVPRSTFAATSAAVLPTQPTTSISNPTLSPNNNLGDNAVGGEKKCSLYLEAGCEASAALAGIKWGGPNCNLDLTIGDVVALLPAPRVEGELVTLYYSWDLDSNASNDARKNGGAAVASVEGAAGVVQQVQNNTSNTTTQRGIAPALPGEDAHASLKRALKAAIEHAAKQKEVAAGKVKAVSVPVAAAATQPTTGAPVEVGPPTNTASIGKKRQRTELEIELEHALNNGVDGDGVIDAVVAEQQQQQQKAYTGALEDGGNDGSERPAQRARVPVGNLFTTTTAEEAGAALAGGKTKAKKSPTKKAASTKKRKGHGAAEPSPVAPQSAQQLQQMHQQQHMQLMHQQQLQMQQMQQSGVALVGGMPLPAGMANYLQWPPSGTPQAAQTAQVLQGLQQQRQMGYMPYGMQPPQFYANPQMQQPQQQQQQTPVAMMGQQRPQTSLQEGPVQGFNGDMGMGMNSLFGDSMFRSIFDTPMPSHQQLLPPQQQQQQQRGAAAGEGGATGMQKDTINNGATATVFNNGAFNTPAKEPRPTSPRAIETKTGGTGGGDNTISKLPLDWACLSPPPNFKLPADFGTGIAGGTPGGSGRLGSGTLGGGGGASLLGINGHSLLPSTSLLGFMDAHPKAPGAAATVMQKGVEALFQQLGGTGGGGGGGGDDEEALAAEAAAAGRAAPTDTSLHSIESLLEKSNSNWLAPFASAQGAVANTNTTTGTAKNGGGDKKKSYGGGQQEDVPPVCNRPFAALFGS